MSKKIKVQYECQHPSCQVFCKKGVLLLDESEYGELSDAFKETDLFKSPRDACRLGFSQPFKAVLVEDESEGGVAREEANEVLNNRRDEDPDDPITILKAEHMEVSKKLDRLEEQLRKRDIDGLWVTTAQVIDDIIRHSLEKEEQVLFPLVRDVIPMGPSYIAIMHEDHKEFVSLLHSMREALIDNEILDGISTSIVGNLRSHIRKEDGEFFDMIDANIEDDLRLEISEKMNAIAKLHVTFETGDRNTSVPSSYSEQRKRIDAEIDALKHNISNQVGGGCEHQ